MSNRNLRNSSEWRMSLVMCCSLPGPSVRDRKSESQVRSLRRQGGFSLDSTLQLTTGFFQKGHAQPRLHQSDVFIKMNRMGEETRCTSSTPVKSFHLDSPVDWWRLATPLSFNKKKPEKEHSSVGQQAPGFFSEDSLDSWNLDEGECVQLILPILAARRSFCQEKSVTVSVILPFLRKQVVFL